jgi:DNA-binding SARP family transcriptional activator
VFSLKLLGCAALENDGVPVSGRAVHRRRMAVLAVLAAARGRMVGRERLIGYLWPDHSGDAARHLLSESLYILRKAIGDDAFVSAGDELSLDPAVVRSDLGDFLQALDADEPERAVALYGGPFLDGFYVSDAADFERWAEQERDRIARAHARALESLAESAEAEGAPLRAAEWWKRLAREDPYSSRIALRVMRALEAGGERAAAVRHASVHAALVRGELGAEPDAEIESFARALRDAPRPAPAPPPAIAAGDGGTAVIEAAPAVAVAAPAPAPAATPAAPSAPEAAPRGRRRTILAGLGIAAVAVAAALGLFFSRGAGEKGDDSLFIVLPFESSSGAGAGLTPDQAELLVYDALSRWRDVRLVDAQRARDLMARRGPPGSLSEARRIAADAGAGRLVWGEITPLGDSVAVRAALYDRSGDAIAERTVRVSHDLNGASQKIGELVAALVGHGGSAGEAAGTNSLAAWQAYQRGRSDLGRWDLEGAAKELAKSVEIDPGYASAHLWLAQADEWAGGSRAEWREHAVRALADADRLSARERDLARALALLGELRYPEACAAYQAMIARDSADFAAWNGLGECQSRDQLVLRDPSSPSGWRFRSSYHRAILAYSRALRTVPSALQAFRGPGFARLEKLLQTDDRQLRPGWALGEAPGDTLRFAAYVSLAGDTVAYVPWPVADIAALKKETIPPTRAAAGVHNRAILADVLREWTRAFPESPDAHEGLARALEAVGQIRAVKQDAPSAFSEVAAARRLATDPEQRLRLAVAQVRLHLRVSDFARARALADSTLSLGKSGGPREARALAPLAVVTGNVEMVRALLRAAAPEREFSTLQGKPVDVPVPVAEAQADAEAYAAVGLADEERDAEARVVALLGSWIGDPQRRDEARMALLSGPRRVSGAYGTPAAAPLATPDYVVEMQQMLARGDLAGVRGRLAWLAEARGPRRPGDTDLSFLFAESALRLAVADTAGAQAELDRTLLALQALPPSVLDTPEEAGSLVGLMRLRVRLATARRDTRTAAYWRTALSTLWSAADPRLKAAIR